MEVRDAIAKRRSIRKFTADGHVGDDDLLRIVEAGRLAPSWKNRQPWRFIIIRSPGGREKIAAALPESNTAARAIRAASAVIVLVGVPAEGEVHQGKDFYLVDCGIAGEHMFLQATELGIASVWVSLVDGPRICAALGLPAGMECVGVFPLGLALPEAEERPRTDRRPLGEIAFFEEYGRSFAPGS